MSPHKHSCRDSHHVLKGPRPSAPFPLPLHSPIPDYSRALSPPISPENPEPCSLIEISNMKYRSLETSTQELLAQDRADRHLLTSRQCTAREAVASLLTFPACSADGEATVEETLSPTPPPAHSYKRWGGGVVRLGRVQCGEGSVHKGLWASPLGLSLSPGHRGNPEKIGTSPLMAQKRNGQDSERLSDLPKITQLGLLRGATGL